MSFDQWWEDNEDTSPMDVWEAATKAERERCAEIAFNMSGCLPAMPDDFVCEACGAVNRKKIAAAIRAG